MHYFSKEYINKFNEITEKNFRLKEENTAPNNWINSWRDFLYSEVYEGYTWESAEFANEISGRKNIELLVKDEALLKFEEHKIFVEKIYELDEFFRKITIDSPYYSLENWWDNKILKYSYEYYYCLQFQTPMF